MNLHVLSSICVTHDHTHGQSRGKSLKSAEGYTFEYTDLVHRCFKHSSSSRSAAVTQRALPVIVADPIMSADQEMRRETLEIFESHFRQIVASGYYLEDGYSEDVDAVLNGVLGQHTAHSVLAGLVEKNPWLEPELGPLIRTPRQALATFTGVPTSQDYQTVHILISDSTLCLVSGSKRKPQRFDLADHFQAYRPTYCKHFHHECLWGAELPFLLKRARIAVRSLKSQFPGCMLLVGVVWSGNELIGKKGIEAQSSWPFDHPDGDHYMELQEKVQEELVGFAADMFRYGVHSADISEEAKLVDQAQGVILQGESSRAWAILDASQDSPQPILLPDWFQAPIGRSITLWQKEGDAWQERAIKRRNAGHTGFTPKVEQNYQAWLENPSRRIVLDKNRQAQVMNLQAKNLQELKSSCLLLEIKMRNEPSELRIRSGSGMWFQLALMEGVKTYAEIPEQMDVPPGPQKEQLYTYIYIYIYISIYTLE